MSSARTNKPEADRGGLRKPSADGVPAWQRRDAVDPAQYQEWLDSQNAPSVTPPAVQEAASRGVDGPGSSLPHMGAIQASFGHHDVTGVQAHVGGPATDAANQLGAHGYATGNNVAFAAAPDLHLAAHEAAHVVQQRQGVSLKGGVGQAGDRHEQHADAVADAVVRGDSAQGLLDRSPGGGAGRPAVQLFGSLEHKHLGDAGSGGEVYERNDLALSHGDLTMLRGDYFEEETLLELWKHKSPKPGQQRGTQDEVIFAIRDATGGNDTRFEEGGPWANLKFSDDVKWVVHERYYRLASHNEDHFVDPDGIGVRGREGLSLTSAPASYRDAHERALAQAYQSGAKSDPLGDAMIVEAMGQHFLTDSFAAGHVTTPRDAIVEQWRNKYPDFGQQFVDKLVRDVSKRLGNEASLLSDAIPVSTLESGVRSKVLEALSGKPLPTLGDLLASVAHDYDNNHGVRVINDLGWRWEAFGDSHLGDSPDATKDREKDPTSERTHKDVVIAAVAAGCDDVRTAFTLGQQQQKTPLGTAEAYDQVRQLAQEPATAGDKYAPEQFMPRPDPASTQGDLAWQAEDLESLWELPIRPYKPTYGELIATDAREGTTAEQLGKIHDGLDQQINPFNEVGGFAGIALTLMGAPRIAHGYLYPRQAFERAVLARLSDKQMAKEFLIELVSNR